MYLGTDAAAWEAKFFQNRPEALGLWRELATTMGLPVAATKSRVCLVARTRFLWCPVAHVKGSIIVRFISPMPISSERLRRDVMPDGRISHRVTLTELDEEAMAWFRAAAAFDQG
ncbi:MAG: hypothetical protein ACPHK8_03630 [Thermoplasmatota archaeon]